MTDEASQWLMMTISPVAFGSLCVILWYCYYSYSAIIPQHTIEGEADIVWTNDGYYYYLFNEFGGQATRLIMAEAAQYTLQYGPTGRQ